MTEITPPPPPSPPAPGVPPPPPGAPPPPAAPPKKGLSTGMKIAIGCGIVLLLVLLLIATCTIFVGKKVRDFGESMEDQEKASEKVEDLEREHPFAPPADGTLDEDQVDKFFAVTDDAWAEMKDWVGDMEKRARRMEESGREEEQAGFRDVMAAVGGMGRARVTLAEALGEHDMSPGAYVWTGARLMQAHEALQSQSTAGVPEKNLDIAREHADEIADLKDEDEEKTGKGAVWGIALVLFPRADAFLPAGLDTTFGRPD